MEEVRAPNAPCVTAPSSRKVSFPRTMADDSLRSTPEHAAAALGGGTHASAGGEDEGEVRNLKPKKKLIHKVRARSALELTPNHSKRLPLNLSEPVATPLAGCQVLDSRTTSFSIRGYVLRPFYHRVSSRRAVVDHRHSRCDVAPNSQEDPEHPIDAQEDVGNLPTKISSSPPKAK